LTQREVADSEEEEGEEAEEEDDDDVDGLRSWSVIAISWFVQHCAVALDLKDDVEWL
jgi:hypothetical protein